MLICGSAITWQSSCFPTFSDREYNPKKRLIMPWNLKKVFYLYFKYFSLFLYFSNVWCGRTLRKLHMFNKINTFTDGGGGGGMVTPKYHAKRPPLCRNHMAFERAIIRATFPKCLASTRDIIYIIRPHIYIVFLSCIELLSACIMFLHEFSQYILVKCFVCVCCKHILLR